MNRKILILTGIYALLSGYGVNATSLPTFSIELPQATSSKITVNPTDTATITYSVTNNTNTARTLTMVPITSISQTPIANSCNFPSILGPKMSCNLALTINGAQVPAGGLSGGPQICKTLGPGNNNPDRNLCSQPSPGSILTISTSGAFLSQAINQANSLVNNMLFPLKANMPQGAAAWKVKPSVSFIWGLLSSGFNIPASANLLSTSCGTPYNGSTYCALVGNMFGAPALFQSTNGGLTWTTVAVAGMPVQGELKSVSCGTDPNGISTCAAIGVDNLNQAFALHTTNSGQTWSKVTAINFGQTIFKNVDCTVNSATSLCQLTGIEDLFPVIYYFTPATGWQTETLLILSASSSTNAISCASLPNSSINCLVSVIDDFFGINLIRTEYDLNYSAAVVNNPATQGTNIRINDVACTENAGSVFCTAAGNSSNAPFLLQNSNLSVDASWSTVTVNNPVPAQGELVATCCTSLNNTAYCNAAGSGNSAPLLVNTIDNGANWSIPVVNSVPQLGTYTTTSCSISNGSPLVTVSGTNSVANTPFIVELTNPFGVWSISNTLSTIYTF